MDYMSVKEAAEKWNMSQRFVQRRCLEGRIDGATKFGTAWMIPNGAKRPNDMRSAGNIIPNGTPPPKNFSGLTGQIFT